MSPPKNSLPIANTQQLCFSLGISWKKAQRKVTGQDEFLFACIFCLMLGAMVFMTFQLSHLVKNISFHGLQTPSYRKIKTQSPTLINQPNALWHMRVYHSEWNCNTNCEVETTQKPTRKTQFQRSATQVTWITVSWSNPTSSVTPLWCSKWNIAWTRHQQRSEFSFLVSIKSTDHCWLAGWWFGGSACSRHTPGGRDPYRSVIRFPG